MSLVSSRSAGVVACSVLALATFAALPGCLISSQRKATVSGREVTAAEVSNIVPGTTTEGDVLTRFGPPSSTTQLSDGGKMHAWNATTREASTGTIFLIFSGVSVKEKTRSVMVACKDGIVTSVNVK